MDSLRNNQKTVAGEALILNKITEKLVEVLQKFGFVYNNFAVDR